MKTKVFNTLLLLLSLTSTQLFAVEEDPEKDYVKTIERVFDIAPDGTVSIENKYGNVFIESNMSNRAQFEVEIIVDASSEKKANEVFKKISVDFQNSGSMVSAITNIESRSGVCWGSSSNYNFQINYYVQIPIESNLVLDNKYGNIELTSLHKGPVDIHLKYGDLEAVDIDGPADLQIKYGNGKVHRLNGYTDLNLGYVGAFEVDYIKEGKIQSAYTKIFANRFGDVDIDSKYSKFEIKEADVLKNSGKYDHWKVEEGRNIRMDTEYSKLDLSELINSLVLFNSYGKLNIDQLGEFLEEITVDAAYMPVRIGNTDGASFNLDVETSHSGIEIDLDTYMDVLKEYDSFSKELSARKGKDPKAKVKIELKYGSVEID